MTNHITNNHLDMLLTRINQTAGTALNYGDTYDGQFKANVGHYKIDSAYSGHKLAQVVNEGGAETDISTGGFVSKRELYNQMSLFLRGLEIARTEFHPEI